MKSVHRMYSLPVAVAVVLVFASLPTGTTAFHSTTLRVLAGRHGFLSNPASPQRWSRRSHEVRRIRDKGLIRAAASVTQEEANNDHSSRLDAILGRLTNAFPIFVLSSAVVALTAPSTLVWVNQGNIISIMLASVMCGTGLTLQKEDFLDATKWKTVPLGVACQYMIMPITAWLVGRLFLLKTPTAGADLFLGLVLVGCSPGGTASNLVSLIAGADVALSVILTACSTMLAVFMTPLTVKWLVGSEIVVSGWALCEATSRVVLGPVVLGMLLKARLPKLADSASRIMPFLSVVLVSLICGGVVAQNAGLLVPSGVAAPAPLGVLLGSVLLLHCTGFLAGYVIPKLFGKSEQASRTVSIEVGMQNSALAVVLARSLGAAPLAAVPGALSATVHSCVGSLLAAIWRWKAVKGEGKDGEQADYII